MTNSTRITRPRLAAVSSAADCCLDVKFADGAGGRVSLKDSVSGAVNWASMGWEVEWPQFDIQIGADTFLADLLEQQSKVDLPASAGS